MSDICKSGTWETQSGGEPRVQGQSGYRPRPCLKNKGEKGKEKRRRKKEFQVLNKQDFPNKTNKSIPEYKIRDPPKKQTI